ncbi:ABC transporter substrate-binding protein [Ruminococcaceae bacterium OttesenSCG-928-A16]|nr:ABC transporter substrate-binding protein [Ruminococcaceae bacterium OttesenSCG-928-A16]
MKIGKKLALLMAAVLAATTFAACTGNATPSAGGGAAASNGAATPSTAGTGNQKTVKIGVAGCITGANAESGRQTVQGAELAAKYINENGGIKALDGAQVELVLIDNTSDPNQSALALERVLDANNDIVGIVGNPTSSALLPMLPILQKYKIPALASTAANSSITEQGCEYIFQPSNTGGQQSEQMIAFLQYLAQKMGLEAKDLKIGILYENSSWGQDVAKGNRENCEKAGLTVAIEETYPSTGLSDASPIVTKLKNAGVDVLLTASYVPDTKLLVSTMTSMQYKPIIIGSGGGLGWPSLVNDMGSDTDGICCINAWLWDAKFVQDNTEFYDNIRLQYEESHNDEFMAEQVGPAFICTMMIAEALENGQSTDPTVVRDEVMKLTGENSEWFALFNPYSAFDENGRNVGNIGHSPMMGQWQDGRLRTVFPEEYASTNVINPLTLEPFAG